MKIKINEIESYRAPENYTVSVDDRIEKIEVINGNCVQDYGHISSGDVISFTALFHKDAVAQIAELWVARTLVTFTDEAGNILPNQRIVVRSYKYEPRFPDYYQLTLELWSC